MGVAIVVKDKMLLFPSNSEIKYLASNPDALNETQCTLSAFNYSNFSFIELLIYFALVSIVSFSYEIIGNNSAFTPFYSNNCFIELKYWV